MKSFFVILSTLMFLSTVKAQNDSLLFENDIVIVGEIKGMNRGVIAIETDFSDSDFKISWDKVREIYGSSEYIISLSTGTRFTGTINTDSSDISQVVLQSQDQKWTVGLNDVVFIKPLEEGFLQKLNASIDLGVNITKANNLRQLTLRSNIGYLTDRWSSDASLDVIRSVQDSIDATRRSDASAGFNYFLGKAWYASVSSKFLQNDEQKLKLRATPLVSLGNYIIQTNSMYWGIGGGIAWNIENYNDPELENRSSSEVYGGTELNMFDMGDFSLLTNLSVYKSLSAQDRIRADFKFDVKYDLPLDFYIRVGYTHNYDSEPVEGAAENDWVLQTTFGWEL
jgi:hypothetical protein